MKTDNIIVDKTFEFSLLIIDLMKEMTKQREFIISKQILRSGTSIGANVSEAIRGNSKKDFAYKLSISLKEANETRYWLRLIKCSKIVKIELDLLLNEIEQIIKLLTSIIKTTRISLKK